MACKNVSFSIIGTITAIKRNKNKTNTRFCISDGDIIVKCITYECNLISNDDIDKTIIINHATYDNKMVVLNKTSKIYKRKPISTKEEIKSQSEAMLNEMNFIKVQELEPMAGLFSFYGVVTQVCELQA